MEAVSPAPEAAAATHTLLPVLPLGDGCLFPESSLSLVVTTERDLRALEIARRAGGRLLAVGSRDAADAADLRAVGTIARVSESAVMESGAHRVDLDGLNRGRVITLVAGDILVAEVEPLEEGDPGEDWGPAVEALARYLHAHAELRAFLDRQRRSAQPMSWVNLACQHLPITASARQRLLEAGAVERCLKISRGLEALLRKEHSG
jgi:ATP-dependent Lon protease